MKIVKKILLIMGLLSIVIAQLSFATVPTRGENGKVEWTQVNNINLPSKPVDIAYSLDGRYSFFLTLDSHVLIYDQKGVLQGNIPVDKGVSAIDIDPRGQFIHLLDSSKSIATTLALDFIVDINSTNAPFKGKVDAPVTIAVFSDFQ